eukprot:6483979-Amphidinium_carterae.1
MHALQGGGELLLARGAENARGAGDSVGPPPGIPLAIAEGVKNKTLENANCTISALPNISTHPEGVKPPPPPPKIQDADKPEMTHQRQMFR